MDMDMTRGQWPINLFNHYIIVILSIIIIIIINVIKCHALARNQSIEHCQFAYAISSKLPFSPPFWCTTLWNVSIVAHRKYQIAT